MRSPRSRQQRRLFHRGTRYLKPIDHRWDRRFRPDNGQRLPASAGVPGTVRGLELAHQKYGRKPWAELLDPAVKLASDGFPVSYSFDASLRSESEARLLSQFPESKRIFLSGHYGDKFVQPELAATLKRIRDRGASDFYEGETAQKLASAMAANGGLITLADLKAYQAEESQPLSGRYKDYEIIAAPPPSAGGVGLLQTLGVQARSRLPCRVELMTAGRDGIHARSRSLVADDHDALRA